MNHYIITFKVGKKQENRKTEKKQEAKHVPSMLSIV